MKKISTLLLATILTFGLVACGNSGENNSAGSEAQSAATNSQSSSMSALLL